MKKKREAPILQKPVKKSRKELRKEQRQLKKLAKTRYFDIKRKISKEEKNSHDINTSKTKSVNIKNKIVDDSKQSANLIKKKKQNTNSEVVQKKTHEKLMGKMKDQRKRQLLDANKDEEREIKFLEKKLKLANKKAISTSKGFVDSGLDYILDVCDPDRIKNSIDSEVNFDDSDSDFFEDYSVVNTKCDINEGKKGHKNNLSKETANSTNITESSKDSQKKKVSFSLEEESDETENNSDHENSNDDSSTEASDSNNVEDDELSLPPNEPAHNEVWEDIYGRLRDKKGNILHENKGKYVPPHLRNIDESDESKKRKEMLRIMKGLINRLALNNMHSITNQIEELFSKNSRNSVNEALYSLYVESVVSPVSSPETLVVDHAMLVAALHGNVGSEIGAYMLQNLVCKFCSLLALDQPVENKELDNLLLLISYLYNFKLFEAGLMYDILNKLSSELTEKNVDLILVVLKSVGFSLRKDDPLAMKGFLLTVQKQINKTSNVEDRSRMKYMLDILLTIKNNNVSKLSDFDPAHHDHLKKVLKSVLRSGNSIVPLRIGLEDLLKAEERGRWWLIGSAWTNVAETEKVKSETVPREEFSAKLLALAKKQKMNTENRRNLFCILMSAEDYQDAFEKVLKLGLRGQQEREIPLVIVHCLLQEKNYNPYYAHVADQLCVSNRRHQMSLQCALWDRFRALEKLSASQVSLLAKFLAQLLLAGSLPISVLKVVEFTELDKRHIRLLRQTILSVANEEALDSIKQVFDRVSKSKKLSLFREALRLFIHHFILRNMPDGKLKERILCINSILSGEIG